MLGITEHFKSATFGKRHTLLHFPSTLYLLPTLFRSHDSLDAIGSLQLSVTVVNLLCHSMYFLSLLQLQIVWLNVKLNEIIYSIEGHLEK